MEHVPLAKSIFQCIRAILFVAEDATWRRVSLSHESSQIMLSSAGIMLLIRFRKARTKGK